MLELLRQRRWLGFTAFAVAMVVLCLLLARWQWHRYELRQTENARLDAALGAPGVPLGDVLPATQPGAPPREVTPDQLWRSVTATGTFDMSGEVAVRRRPLDGRNGFWVVTPLVTDAGIVLVNRGWAPAGAEATAAPDVAPAPAGRVTVTGRLRAAEETKQDDDPPPGQAWAADPRQLVDSQAPRFDAYIELRGAQPAADLGLTQLSDPGHKGANNLVYSVQWVIFGLVVGIGWWRLLRQEQRHAGAGPSQDDDVANAGDEAGTGAAARVESGSAAAGADPGADPGAATGEDAQVAARAVRGEPGAKPGTRSLEQDRSPAG